ncbi:MAG: hypothetical protein H0V93_06875 [Euzebyales bacterium]|nr:hypothetical protein [Euzebyales bacterium]
MTIPPVPSLDEKAATCGPQPGTAWAQPLLPAVRSAGTRSAVARPPRAVAMASISSMKPMAPPSRRATQRSALK